MLTTSTLFFIGACFYINEMLKDLTASLAEYDENTNLERMIVEFQFHKGMLE